MTDHDPLCPFPGHKHDGCITCDLIDRVRADERERCKEEVAATAKWCREDERETIAQAILDVAMRRRQSGPRAYMEAARIARNGGRDE